MERPELVVFDMEGTLFKKVFKDEEGHTATSAWTLLAHHLGEDALAEEEATKQKWENGEYASYIAWVEDTIRIHQKYGLDRTYFEQLIKSVEYRDGVADVFAALNDAGVRTAVVTGGFKAQAERVQRDFGVNHILAACEYYWADDGTMDGYNILPSDHQGKQAFVDQLLDTYGITRDDVAFVGDGANDVPIAMYAGGPTLAIDGAEELRDVADASISTDNGSFADVLNHFDL